MVAKNQTRLSALRPASPKREVERSAYLIGNASLPREVELCNRGDQIFISLRRRTDAITRVRVHVDLYSCLDNIAAVQLWSISVLSSAAQTSSCSSIRLIVVLKVLNRTVYHSSIEVKDSWKSATMEHVRRALSYVCRLA